MANAARVTIGTTATFITSGRNAGDTDTDILINHRGTNPVYIGGPEVTTTTGYQLDTTEVLGIQLAAGEPLYGIVAAGTEVIHYLRTK